MAYHQNRSEAGLFITSRWLEVGPSDFTPGLLTPKILRVWTDDAWKKVTKGYENAVNFKK
jgi:hypothetical protein